MSRQDSNPEDKEFVKVEWEKERKGHARNEEGTDLCSISIRSERVESEGREGK